eukprot:9727684-Karenia_brevis.AAC.1
MKSPIGPTDFCENEVSKRVNDAIKIFNAISVLPDKHCALQLLRYQTGRMDYTIRTTPLCSCRKALTRLDTAMRLGYERILGQCISDEQW